MSWCVLRLCLVRYNIIYHTLYNRPGHSGCTAAIASASFFAVVLTVCVTVSVIVITVLVYKDKVKIPTILKMKRKEESSTSDTRSTSQYEDVRHKPMTIDTSKNVAYGKSLASLSR